MPGSRIPKRFLLIPDPVHSVNPVYFSGLTDPATAGRKPVIQLNSVKPVLNDLKDRHHEIHQKHRHAFAGGLLDHRWPSRVRLECRASHLPALRCSAGRRGLHSHWQIAVATSNTCRTKRPSDLFDRLGSPV